MNQIFKKIPSIDYLFSLLDKFAVFENNFYLIDKTLYKKLLLNNIWSDFIDIIIPFYYKSKLFYAKKNPSYKNFLTVIRQICNINTINFSYSFSYQKSSYEIIYKIFKNI